MKPQRQFVQMSKDVDCETPRRILANTLKHDIAQIVEKDTCEAGASIGKDKRYRYACSSVPASCD